MIDALRQETLSAPEAARPVPLRPHSEQADPPGEGQGELVFPPDPADLPAALESLLFVATEPTAIGVLARALGVRVAAAERAARELSDQLQGRGLRLQRSGTQLQLATAADWSGHVRRFLGLAAEQPLSRAALETLAIVAYRQPVTRATIEGLRGVTADRALATLRSRDLIDEIGRAETIGRPILYGTTMRFLEYLGVQNLGELPALPEPASEP
jgi:segregation and condensation protein B